MNTKEFSKHLLEESEEDYGICPPPLEAQKGLNILIEHFLGKDWYVALSVSTEQVNSEAVYSILLNYPKKKFK